MKVMKIIHESTNERRHCLHSFADSGFWFFSCFFVLFVVKAVFLCVLCELCGKKMYFCVLLCVLWTIKEFWLIYGGGSMKTGNSLTQRRGGKTGIFTTEDTENTEVKPESANECGVSAYIHWLMYYLHYLHVLHGKKCIPPRLCVKLFPVLPLCPPCPLW